MYYPATTTPQGSTYPYVAVVLILDDQVVLTNRRVFTIIEALSATGGIIGFVYVSVELMIRFL